MKVLHILLSYWFLVPLLCPGHGAEQFNAAYPTCPGDTFNLSCTVVGNMTGFTIWRVGGSSECHLIHSSTSPSSVCGPGNAFIARGVTGFGPATNATSFSSTLSGTATSELDDILVECFGPANNVEPENSIGNTTLHILGPPPVPTLSCVELSEDVNGTVNVTVSWTLGGGDSADSYLISITTNAPQTPYEGLLNITTASVTQHKLTGFMAGYEYNITVRGVNCGSQEGSESEPLTIRPQVPTTPALHVCAVYDVVNETLQIIESTWNEVDNVTVSEDCANGRDIRASYELSYITDSGTLNTTCVVNGTECSNGTCRHELQNNTADSRCYPPVSQFSVEDVTVSLTARNIVGRSNPAVSRNISDRNFCDLVVRIDTTNPMATVVECTFFQREYTCTIDYGKDQSYTNLVYRNTSYIPGRQANITLSQRLRGDTTYYYIVSAERNSLCVKVRGSFRAGCSEADLTQQSGIANLTRCTDREFVNGSSICDGVVCHNGTTEGSRAVYICNDGFVLMEGDKATRICQNDGSWNGSTPQCIPEGRDQTGGIVGSFFGGAVVGAVICVVVWIFVYQRRRKRISLCITARDHDDNEDDNEDDNDMTPLHIAAQQGDMKTVANLVDNGADVHTGDKNGMTPLHLAAQRGRYNLVGYLVDKDADVNIQDINGRTPLHFAASEGHEYTVKSLVEKGANVNIKNKAGMTPLHLAAERGRYKTIVVDLVKLGAEVDIRDVNEWTPMHVAAREGYMHTVKSLVENGANINLKNKDGRTPLEIAVECNHVDVVEYLNKLGGEAAGPEVEETTEPSEDTERLIPTGQDDKSTRADTYITDTTSLHVAAQQGDVNKVKTLADTGADTNAKDKNGMTPLHAAAEKGRFNIIKPLVDKGANINIEDNDGRTPLHIAVKEGYEHTVECIVDNGADINFQDKNGMTPLHAAAENGRFGLVKALVNKRANIIFEDKNGRTPLHIAAREGYEYTVECLVRQGAVIDMKDKDGRTPIDVANERGHVNVVEYLQGDWTSLHNAVREGQVSKVKSLVAKGADVNRRDKNGWAPLHVAAERCRCEQILGYLVEKEADINIQDNKGWTPLHIAVRESQERTVKCIVGNKADKDIKGSDGMTPLHVAAQRGDRISIMEYLVDQGADINIKDDNGRTPLHIATKEGHELTVKSLVDKGADKNIQDKAEMAPLHVAAERGDRISMVNYLVDQGADINIKGDNRRTPLHIATKEGHEVTVKSLVDKGADKNIQDKAGMTPLHVAAQRDRISIVEYLVDQGADINIKDSNRRTPLHTAAGEGHEVTVKYLVDQGADINIKDKTGKTPQDVADESGHMNIVEFLGGATVLNTHPPQGETEETSL